MSLAVVVQCLDQGVGKVHMRHNNRGREESMMCERERNRDRGASKRSLNFVQGPSHFVMIVGAPNLKKNKALFLN